MHRMGLLTFDMVVSDDGVGMSEEFQKRMFDPFTQVNQSKAANGTGLGLTIVKQLVEMMGGKISVQSAVGRGSRFTVHQTLPIAAMPENQKDKRAEDFSVLKGKHMLLCEDHPLNAEITTRLLQKEGMTCDAASDGSKGVALFTQSAPYHYDAILMDVRMPVMDGLEATRVIRALPRPDAAAVPIIAMTANAYDEDREKTRAAGMNEHLSKPADPKKLYQTLVGQINDAR